MHMRGCEDFCHREKADVRLPPTARMQRYCSINLMAFPFRLLKLLSGPCILFVHVELNVSSMMVDALSMPLTASWSEV